MASTAQPSEILRSCSAADHSCNICIKPCVPTIASFSHQGSVCLQKGVELQLDVRTKPDHRFVRHRLSMITSASSILVPSSIASPSISTAVPPPSASSSLVPTTTVFLSFCSEFLFRVLDEQTLLFLEFLWCLFDLDRGFGEVGRPAWVCFLAGLSIWAEAAEIQLTKLFPDVSL